MGVSKLNLENMNEDLVKRFNTLDLYTKSGLNTETTTALVDALNEIIGKNIISKSVGAPLENTDLWKDMGTKIDSIVNDLRNNLSNKGINVKGKVLSELVNLVINIPEDTSEIDRNIVKLISEALGRPITEDDSVVEVCENIDGMTKDFRDKLSSKGVNVEETDRMMDLVAKVDDVGRGGELMPDSWETKASMGISVCRLTSSVADNKIYCIGGNNSNSDNMCYDSSTDTWSTKANMTTGRRYLTSGTVDNKIYCIGGYTSSHINKNECYDTTTDTWETKASMITARYGLTSSVVDNKIYCIGGFTTVNSNKNECYDTTTDTWSTKASESNRHILTSSVVDNKIYCIGGFSGSSPTGYNNCYDSSTDTWSTKTTMITARYGLTSSVVDNKIYCIGGQNSSYSHMATNECYDPLSNTWSTKTDMTKSRRELTSSVVDNKIYCIAGYSNINLATNECYVPEHPAPNSLVQALGDSLGISYNTNDSVYDVCDKIDLLTVEFRNKLSEKGLEVSEDEKIFDLINKLDLI